MRIVQPGSALLRTRTHLCDYRSFEGCGVQTKGFEAGQGPGSGFHWNPKFLKSMCADLGITAKDLDNV
jgi:hypothetical protein